MSRRGWVDGCYRFFTKSLAETTSREKRKLREKKELIFPVDTKSPLKRIFIALKTSDLKKDKSGQIYGYVNLKVIFKDKNDRFNSVVFQVDTMPVNAPYGSYIGNILLGDGTSLVSSIIADE